jgi:hypothetical protein
MQPAPALKLLMSSLARLSGLPLSSDSSMPPGPSVFSQGSHQWLLERLHALSVTHGAAAQPYTADELSVECDRILSSISVTDPTQLSAVQSATQALEDIISAPSGSQCVCVCVCA